MNWIIGNASLNDWLQIEALLNSVKLPLDALRENLGSTLVARADDKVVGCAALELYGEFALLRSVMVDKAQQGKGLGQELTRAALDLARQ